MSTRPASSIDPAIENYSVFRNDVDRRQRTQAGATPMSGGSVCTGKDPTISENASIIGCIHSAFFAEWVGSENTV